MERCDGGGGKKIAGHQPGEGHVIVQRGADIRDRGRNNILVQRRLKHGGKHADDDIADFLL